MIDKPYMCPHCGERFAKLYRHLIPKHILRDRDTSRMPIADLDVIDMVWTLCPGSGQNPRNAESDKRRLWKDGGES